MEFLFDCANIESIRKYGEYFPIAGVTSNPSIIKTEGQIDFIAHFKAIRSLIGMDKSLHIQVLADTYDGMTAEAEAILREIDERVYIKVPSTEEGFKTMRALKALGRNVTATAVYTKIQAFIAIACEADYVAPYCNRMENMDIDFRDTVSSIRRMIDDSGVQTKILAASFKNAGQVCEALLAGAHAVTVQPSLLHEALQMPSINKAVVDFKADWVASQGNVDIADLK
jgi:TalC/MipB family fructose-6-phosphate aldolase